MGVGRAFRYVRLLGVLWERKLSACVLYCIPLQASVSTFGLGVTFATWIEPRHETITKETNMFPGIKPSWSQQCTYIHDEEPRSRERMAIVLGTSSDVRYRNGGATGNGGPAATPPLPLAPLPARPTAVPLARAAESETSKPMNWRTQICMRWEEAGYCSYGSKCMFAHGEAELQQYGGAHADKDNPNNQGVRIPNVVAATRSLVAHEGSAEWRSYSKWPPGINLIYGDWIDDLD